MVSAVTLTASPHQLFILNRAIIGGCHLIEPVRASDRIVECVVRAQGGLLATEPVRGKMYSVLIGDTLSAMIQTPTDKVRIDRDYGDSGAPSHLPTTSLLMPSRIGVAAGHRPFDDEFMSRSPLRANANAYEGLLVQLERLPF